MSVDIGKPADQILADAKKDLAKAFPTEADKTNAANQFQTALNNDPEVKKKAYEDVKKLAETIRNIRKGFIDVASSLVGFDSAEFKDKNGNVLKLGPKWSPYIKQFDDTLQFSLEQATSAAVMMKSINSVLGDVTSGDAADLKIELTNFMTQLKKKEADSLTVKDKFQKLSDDVAIFTAEIDVALEKAAEAIKLELDRAKGQLDQLNKDLKDINEKIHALGIATITEVAVGATAAGVAILTMNPVAIFTAVSSFISAIGTGIALKKAMDEREGIINNIKAKEREIENLNARNELLKKYKTELEKTKGIVTDVSSQIAVIANIWQTINLDMHALSEDLDANVGPDTIITKFFLKKLQVAKDIYSHLVLILETYVEETHNANKSLPMPTTGKK